MTYDLKVFMEKYNLSKAEVAEIIGCSRPTVDILMRRGKISLDCLKKVEEYEEFLKKYDDKFESFSMTKTIKYSEFKFYDFNRPLNINHVRELEESINKNNLLHLFPILVFIENDIKYIVDGQHRFQACVNRKFPFYYRIIDKFTFSVSHINSTSKSWKPLDYLHFFISKKNENYINLKRLLDIFNISNVSIGLEILKFHSQYCSTMDFMKGKLELNTLQLEEVVDSVNKYIKPFEKVIKRVFQKTFISAVVSIFRKCDLDVEGIISNLIKGNTSYFLREDNPNYIVILNHYHKKSKKLKRRISNAKKK